MVVPESNSKSDPSSRDTQSTVVDVRDRLHTAPYAALKSVRCEQRNGQVVLSGRVPSYYLKQVAQSIAMQQPHVRSVLNLIDVS